MNAPSRFDLSPTQKLILQTVLRHEAISRADIAKATGLTAPSVTRLTRDLEALGLTSDRVQRDGARGQPSRPVSLCADGAFALGVNFSHSYIDVGLVDLRGQLRAHERSPLEEPTPERIAAIANAACRRLLATLEAPLSKVVGAGFSAPGDFLASQELNAHAYFPRLRVDLRQALSEYLPVPVTVENDAASAAVGERIHGYGREARSLMLVHIGHGVGSGLILDGQLYRGAYGNAGLVGVLFPTDRPRPSGQDLFQALAGVGLEAADFDALDDIDLEHPAVSAWLSRAGEQLAEGLFATVRVLDPDTVVLGGRLPPRFLKELYRRTPLDQALRRDAPLPSPRFLVSNLGPFAGVIGAASLCFFERFFDSVTPT